MTRKREILISSLRWLLPLAILGAGAIGTQAMVESRQLPSAEEQAPQALLVRTHVVHAEATTLRVHSQGTVRPKTETSLVAQVGGEIREISPALASGGFFGADDLLVRIEARDYELALDQTKARVAQAKRLLAIEEREAELALQEWKRTMGDQPPDPLAAHEPQLAEARANVAAAEAALEKARLDLQRTQVRAPYAGRVSQRMIDRGQVVMPGTPLARVHTTEIAEVRLPLHDSELAFLDLPTDLGRAGSERLGPKVTLGATFAGRPLEWHGHITRIEGEIDPRTRMVYLVAEVPDPYALKDDTPHPPMPVGMFVEATIEGRRVPGVFSVPRQAVRGAGFVYVVDDQQRLWSRTVEVLKTGRDRVIVQRGLEDGARVCLSPIESFLPGMTVEVAPAEETGR